MCLENALIQMVDSHPFAGTESPVGIIVRATEFHMKLKKESKTLYIDRHSF